MRAARYHGVRDVRIDELEVPPVGADEVLVRVAFTGICGSDLHVYAKGMFGIIPPMTMGHEFSGVVERIGDGVTAVKPGDHVIGDPRLGCERCEWCRRGAYHLCAELAFIGEAIPGSFADYIVLPERHLIVLPESLDLRLAALAEPMAVAVHAVDLVVEPGQRTAGIVGAGPIGLLTLVVGRQSRWQVSVADLVPGRRQLAASLGAHEVFADIDEPGSRWADVVLEAAGKSATFAAGIRWLRPGGRMALIGIYEDPVTLDPTDMVVKEARLTGVSAYGRQDLVRAVSLLETEALAARRVIADILPLERATDGLEMSLSGAANGKVLLDCGPSRTGPGGTL